MANKTPPPAPGPSPGPHLAVGAPHGAGAGPLATFRLFPQLHGPAPPGPAAPRRPSPRAAAGPTKIPPPAPGRPRARLSPAAGRRTRRRRRRRWGRGEGGTRDAEPPLPHAAPEGAAWSGLRAGRSSPLRRRPAGRCPPAPAASSLRGGAAALLGRGRGSCSVAAAAAAERGRLRRARAAGTQCRSPSGRGKTAPRRAAPPRRARSAAPRVPGGLARPARCGRGRLGGGAALRGGPAGVS